MSKLKAIIVDDERLSRVNLKRLLVPHDEIEIVGEAYSCKSAIEIIGQFNPELIFLDFQLMGETGFNLIEAVDCSVKIVLVTALDDYRARAFAVNAVDFILKPVNPERLKLVVQKLLNMKGELKRTANYVVS